MRGADLLVRSLKEAGVSRIFSLSGNQIMPVYDACFAAEMEIIHTRHEAAALYMAEAHAQLTGEVGVALVTAGVGLANATGPLFSAAQSETPVLLLSGDSPLRQDGTGAFQEMPQVAVTTPLTKFSDRPARAGDYGLAIAQALATARAGRPGPVHLALAQDVLEADATGTPMPEPAAFAPAPMPPDAAALDALRAALASAARPVLICGPLLNATRFAALVALEEALAAPIIPMESPRGLRDPALGRISEVLAEADLVVSLGKRVDFTLGFGAANTAGQWIVAEPDPAEAARAARNLGPRLLQGIPAGAREMAEAFLQAPPPAVARAEWRAHVARSLAARVPETPASGAIAPQALCAAVQRQLDAAPEPLVICDGGEFGQWAQACCHAPARVLNGTSGAIGGCLPYAMAAAKARPGATVVSLMGDGTAGFHLAEFETAARAGMGCVIVIGNDRRWNAEHLIQMRSYGPDRLIGCELSGARYDLAAAALGAHGEYVSAPDELDAALTRAVKAARKGQPACVNVEIEGAPAPVLTRAAASH